MIDLDSVESELESIESDISDARNQEDLSDDEQEIFNQLERRCENIRNKIDTLRESRGDTSQ